MKKFDLVPSSEAPAHQFAPGDRVRLKCGGAVMVIDVWEPESGGGLGDFVYERPRAAGWKCIYQIQGSVRRDRFAPHLLEPANEPAPKRDGGISKNERP